MKAIVFSGGGTQLPAHIAHGTKILRDYKYEPELIAGVSSGALATLAMGLRRFSQAKELCTTLKLSSFFGGIPPINKEGKIRWTGYARLILKGAMGEMDGLRKTLKNFVSAEEWAAFNAQEKAPLLLVGITDLTTEMFKLSMLNGMAYEEMIEYVVTSCSIPLYCDTVKIGTNRYCDGGVTCHNPGFAIMEEYPISELISCYSRPGGRGTYDPAFNGEYAGRTLSKITGTMTREISMYNESQEILVAAKKGIILRQIFAPRVMKGVYDVDNVRLKQLYDTCFRNI